MPWGYWLVLGIALISLLWLSYALAISAGKAGNYDESSEDIRKRIGCDFDDA